MARPRPGDLRRRGRLGATAGPCSPGTSSPRCRPDRPVTEALDGGALPPSWVGASRFPSEFVTPEDGGCGSTADGEPVFVGRRQEHLHARVRARLDVEGVGGLSVRIDPAHAVDLECADGVVRAVWAVGDVRHVLGERALTASRCWSSAWSRRRVEAGIPGDRTASSPGSSRAERVHRARRGRRPLPVDRGRRRDDRPHDRRRLQRGDVVLLRSFEYVGADDPGALA